MTDRRSASSDQLLAAWFADGPTAMPDRVLDVVADRIGRQRQRRTWRLSWRPFMNTYARFGAAAAAVLVVALAGYALLPRSGPGPGGPSPSPTVAPTAPPTAVPSQTTTALPCVNDTTGCRGVLLGGTFASTNFAPSFSYSVPAGPASGPPASYWRNTLDLADEFILVPNGGGNRFSFQVVSNVAIPEQTQAEGCPARQAAGVGNTVVDWVSFLTKNPAITSTATVPISVGAYSGFRVDFARAATWTASCPNSVGGAILSWMHAGAPERGTRITDDHQESFFILDVAGETVLITVDSGPSTTQHAADMAEAQPIVDSMRFSP